jgi:hypothetical protein
MTTTRRNPSYIYVCMYITGKEKNLDVYLSEEKKREKENDICIDTEEKSVRSYFDMAKRQNFYFYLKKTDVFIHLQTLIPRT